MTLATLAKYRHQIQRMVPKCSKIVQKTCSSLNCSTPLQHPPLQHSFFSSFSPTEIQAEPSQPSLPNWISNKHDRFEGWRKRRPPKLRRISPLHQSFAGCGTIKYLKSHSVDNMFFFCELERYISWLH